MTAKAKITDVAGGAWAVTTVSHTLSGRRPVGQEVCSRVLRGIHELNYRPNYFAGPMKQNRTGLVGILVDQCRNAATGILLEGMEQTLGSHGYEIVLGIAGIGRVKGAKLLEKFALVDGMINMLPQLSSDEAELIAPSLPLVTHLPSLRPGLHRLRRGSAAGVRIFIQFQPPLDRLHRFGTAEVEYAESGADRLPELPGRKRRIIRPGLIAVSADSIEGGRWAAGLLPRGVTAIFAANDQMALGVYQRAYVQNQRIPEKLSMIGYDDTPRDFRLSSADLFRFPSQRSHSIPSKGCSGNFRGKRPIPIPDHSPPLIIRNSTAAPVPHRE